MEIGRDKEVGQVDVVEVDVWELGGGGGGGAEEEAEDVQVEVVEVAEVAEVTEEAGGPTQAAEEGRVKTPA